MITVVCCLWDDPERNRSYKFNESHVITLRNMVRRHLSLEHEFVCISDKERGFHEHGIRWVPLDIRTHVPGTVYARLMIRHPKIGGVLGRRILSLDLDCVIVGKLDFIAGREEDNVQWRNPNYQPGGGRAFFQTSIQLFDCGARSFLCTDFNTKITPTLANRRFGGAEQAWVSERLDWGEAHWTDIDGIYGAGRMFRDQHGGAKMGSGVQSALPENARIVFFPGNRAPHQPEVQKLHPWIEEHYR